MDKREIENLIENKVKIEEGITKLSLSDIIDNIETPEDMDNIYEYCKNNNIFVIEELYKPEDNLKADETKRVHHFSNNEGLNNYVRQICKYPLLTDEEVIYYSKLKDKNNKAAFEKLYISNLRLVIFVAKSFVDRGMELDDLIQEGNLGLEKAVEKYDYSKGYKFSSYATWWIRQTISRALSNYITPVKMSNHCFTAVNKMKKIASEESKKRGANISYLEVAGLFLKEPIESKKIYTFLNNNFKDLSLNYDSIKLIIDSLLKNNMSCNIVSSELGIDIEAISYIANKMREQENKFLLLIKSLNVDSLDYHLVGDTEMTQNTYVDKKANDFVDELESNEFIDQLNQYIDEMYLNNTRFKNFSKTEIDKYMNFYKLYRSVNVLEAKQHTNLLNKLIPKLNKLNDEINYIDYQNNIKTATNSMLCRYYDKISEILIKKYAGITPEELEDEYKYLKESKARLKNELRKKITLNYQIVLDYFANNIKAKKTLNDCFVLEKLYVDDYSSIGESKIKYIIDKYLMFFSPELYNEKRDKEPTITIDIKGKNCLVYINGQPIDKKTLKSTYRNIISRNKEAIYYEYDNNIEKYKKDSEEKINIVRNSIVTPLVKGLKISIDNSNFDKIFKDLSNECDINFIRKTYYDSITDKLIADKKLKIEELNDFKSYYENDNHDYIIKKIDRSKEENYVLLRDDCNSLRNKNIVENCIGINGQNSSLQHIGKEYSISRERARQIGSKGIRRIQMHLGYNNKYDVKKKLI